MILETPWLVYESVAPVAVNGPCNQVLIFLFFFLFHFLQVSGTFLRFLTGTSIQYTQA